MILRTLGRIAALFFATLASSAALAQYPASVHASARQADGKILIAGVYGFSYLLVARLGADGFPDFTFGGSGVTVHSPPPGGDSCANS